MFFKIIRFLVARLRRRGRSPVLTSPNYKRLSQRYALFTLLGNGPLASSVVLHIKSKHREKPPSTIHRPPSTVHHPPSTFLPSFLPTPHVSTVNRYPVVVSRCCTYSRIRYTYTRLNIQFVRLEKQRTRDPLSHHGPLYDFLAATRHFALNNNPDQPNSSNPKYLSSCPGTGFNFIALASYNGRASKFVFRRSRPSWPLPIRVWNSHSHHRLVNICATAVYKQWINIKCFDSLNAPINLFASKAMRTSLPFETNASPTSQVNRNTFKYVGCRRSQGGCQENCLWRYQ